MATIAIDLDNTLVTGTRWLPGAKDAVKCFREAGHKVIIHTCNNPHWAQKLCDEAGLAIDGVWNEKGKPIADLYIDDRAQHFQGDWIEELPDILADARLGE
jgi:hydroxymethylpyrimidine pyrophosphatase-like HAD family hydrolase